MTQLVRRLVLVVGIAATTSYGGEYIRSFKETIAPVERFIKTNEPFRLSDLFDFSQIELPFRVRQALERVIILNRTFTKNESDQSADISFSLELFGQEVQAKLHMEKGKKADKGKDSLKKSPEEEEVSKTALEVKTTASEEFTSKELVQSAEEKNEEEKKESPSFIMNLQKKALTAIRESKLEVSLLLGMPKTFKMSAIDRRLTPFDVVQFSKCGLIVSMVEYKDKEWDIKVGKGLTLVGTMKLAGPFERVGNLIGDRLTEVTLHGTLTPTIIGSQLIAQLPGQIRLGKNLKTYGLTLNVAVKEALPMVPSLVVSVKSGLILTLSTQEEPLNFLGEISIAPEKASLDFYMEGIWRNVLGIPGPSIGNLKFKATTDYAVTAASGGILTLSGIGFGGQMGIGSKSVTVNIYGELSTTTDLLVEGILEGGIFLHDIIDFGLLVASQSARLNALTSSAAQQTAQPIERKINRFKQEVYEELPTIGIDYMKLHMAPKSMSFGGKKYDAGIFFNVRTHLFDVAMEMEIEVTKEGIKGAGKMDPVTLGPIKIDKSTVDRKSTQSTQFITEGPSVILQLAPANDIMAFYLDGQIGIDILGGLLAQTRVDISKKEIYIQFITSIFNQFNTSFELQAPRNKPYDAFVKAEFTQTGLRTLEQFLKEAAVELKKGSEREIAQARKNVTLAQQDVVRAQAELNKLSDRRLKIEQENKQSIARLQNKIRQEIAEIEAAMHELDKVVAECKGDVSLKERLEVDKVVQQQQEPSAQMIEQALQELKKEGLSDEQIKVIRAEIN